MRVILTIWLNGLTLASEPTDLVTANRIVRALLKAQDVQFELLSLVPVEEEGDVGAQEEELALRAAEPDDDIF